MSLIVNKKSFRDYIIKPFTIDCDNTRVFDDAYSVEYDFDGNVCLNISISLISLELLNRNYDSNTLKKDIWQSSVKQYLHEYINEYSLKEGSTHKVLTLKIRKYDSRTLYYIALEDILIDTNYSYSDMINYKFYAYVREILNVFDVSDLHNLVRTLMHQYSMVLSEYLFREQRKLNLNKTANSSYKISSFTSPLREQKSLLNQFSAVKSLENREYILDWPEHFLFEVNNVPLEERDNCKILTAK